MHEPFTRGELYQHSGLEPTCNRAISSCPVVVGKGFSGWHIVQA